ncbi:MAG: acetyl-CoA carboxylase biotin carboxyl carrier protein [Elusimicrobiota bacterium]
MKYKTGLKRIEKMLKAIEGTDIRRIYYGREGLNIGVTRRIKDREIEKEVEEHREKTKKEVEDKKKKTQKERAAEKRKNIVEVKSQSVGIFRDRVPSSKKVLSKVGKKVSQGQKLGVVESMSILKDIISPVSGKIKKKFIKNTQPVEFGQKLFEIEKKD